MATHHFYSRKLLRRVSFQRAAAKFNFPFHLYPTSFPSLTSSTPSSSTSHTSPTSLTISLTVPTSSTSTLSTGVQRVHLSCKQNLYSSMLFAQEFLHRSSYTGALTQELTSRCSTCIWKLLQNSYFSSSAKFSLKAAWGSQKTLCETWPSAGIVHVGRTNVVKCEFVLVASDPLRRSCMSDAQTSVKCEFWAPRRMKWGLSVKNWCKNATP